MNAVHGQMGATMNCNAGNAQNIQTHFVITGHVVAFVTSAKHLARNAAGLMTMDVVGRWIPVVAAQSQHQTVTQKGNVYSTVHPIA